MGGRGGEAAQRPAPVPGAPARARAAGVLRDRGHRSGGGAAVRLAGRDLEPVELGGAALARDRRQRDAAAARARSRMASTRACSARVRAIPGVHAAAPLLEASANAIGPHGSESVELVGADSSLSRLGGALVRRTPLSSFAGVEVVALPAPFAQQARCHEVRAGSDVPAERARRRSCRCTSSCTRAKSGRWYPARSRSRRWPRPRK